MKIPYVRNQHYTVIMKLPKILAPAFCLSLFVFSSCVKDTIDEFSKIKGVKLATTFSVPLVDISIGMKQIYENLGDQASIQEQSDNSYLFSYSATDTVGGTQFVKFPDIPFDYSFKFPDALSILAFELNNGFEVALKDSITFPTANGERLKRLVIKQGSFVLKITNSFKHKTKIIIKYPGLTKNGIPLQDSIQMNFAGSSPLIVTRVINLAGYTFDFSRNGATFNMVDFEYTIGIDRIPANPTTTSDEFKLEQNIQLESYESVVGYLGRFPILKTAESTAIDIFEKGIAGNIQIADPKLVIKIYNSFGMPVTGRINNIRVTKPDGTDLPITIAPFQDTFSFKNPTIIGQTELSEWTIDRNNSNIDVAINSSPKAIKYDLDFTANYNNIVRDNFITDKSSFVASTDFQVPLNIKILDYTILQSSKKASDTTSSLEYVDNIRVGIRAENTLPFDMFVQVLFLKDTIVAGDTLEIVADSLFNNEWQIPGGIVDVNNNVVGPGINTTFTNISSSTFSRIQASKRYQVRSRLNTSSFGGSQSFVKILSSQLLKMKIATDARILYKSKK